MGLCSADEFPDIESFSTPIARIEHVCGECHEKIHPGEKYERYFAVWWGQAETQKTCETCLDLRRRFHEALGDAGMQHELTFHNGELRLAIIELRQEYGLLVDGFDYPTP